MPRPTPKYIIWTPGRGNHLIRPGQTLLRLIGDGMDRSVYLCACDSEGRSLNDGYLLQLRPDGIVDVMGGICEEANMALTTDSMLAVRNDMGEYITGDITFSPTPPT